MDSEKKTQIILVCQQNGSGEAKIAGIRKYGGRRFERGIPVVASGKKIPAALTPPT